jgi:hypothetical protein
MHIIVVYNCVNLKKKIGVKSSHKLLCMLEFSRDKMFVV